eukprot:1157878-Pelagomonas_calceolata.AAC.7
MLLKRWDAMTNAAHLSWGVLQCTRHFLSVDCVGDAPQEMPKPCTFFEAKRGYVGAHSLCRRLKYSSIRATDTLPEVVSLRWLTTASHWAVSRSTTTLPSGNICSTSTVCAQIPSQMFVCRFCDRKLSAFSVDIQPLFDHAAFWGHLQVGYLLGNIKDSI